MSVDKKLEQISREFLEEAKIDLLAVEKLKDNNLTNKRSFFSLQQACEKALKAYFLLIFINILACLSELTDPKDIKLYKVE